MVADNHWQIIRHLTSSYENIVPPPSESQELVSMNRNRGMNKNLMMSSHSASYQRLAFKCQVTGTRLSRMTEEYTSKTCTGYRAIKHTLSLADRTLHCASYNLSVDHDINGARNISSSSVLSHLNRQT
ncbi:unnamed protein product [Cyberlindnera jadinii]|nr:unnamed protein product [Cyberlindnera jadinii]